MKVMPFPKHAHRLGGKAPASDRQKLVARQTIAQTQPWRKSTGPISARGKSIASQNARIDSTCFAFKRIVKSWESQDFSDECRLIDTAFEQLEAYCRSLSCSSQVGISFNVADRIVRKTYTDDQGNCWKLYAANIRLSMTVRGCWPIAGSDDLDKAECLSFLDVADQLYQDTIECIKSTIVRLKQAIANLDNGDDRSNLPILCER